MVLHVPISLPEAEPGGNQKALEHEVTVYSMNLLSNNEII